MEVPDLPLNEIPLYAGEALCCASILPTERVWQRTGLSDPAGNQNYYMQPVWRFFQLLPMSSIVASRQNPGLRRLFDEGRLRKPKCLWGPGIMERSEETWIGDWWVMETCLCWSGLLHSISSGCGPECGPWMARAFDILRGANKLNFYENCLDFKCWH